MGKLGAIGPAVLIATAVGSARAADVLVKAPVPVAAQWSWTGLYIGAHIGAAEEDSRLSDPFGPVPFGDNVRSPAFIAGGQIGGDYQIGNVVLGAAADLSWANSTGDNTCFGISGGRFLASNCGVYPDLLGTFAARLGYSFGRALVFAKGGAAFEQNNSDMIVNANPGEHILTSATRYSASGWMAGGGFAYALTPAWSLQLEYDYLGFGSHNVATPYVSGNPLPLHPVGAIAGLADTVQEFKLGVNYKLGADPWSTAAPIPVWLPLKAPSLLKAPAPVASGWEIEGGARYMYSWGREQWDLSRSNVRTPDDLLVSRLTWNNLMTNSGELYGRIDTPSNLFLSGFIGTGATYRGDQNDEDFNISAVRRYQNTHSTNDGHIGYGVFDLGYDLLRSPDYKLGPFVGYTVFNQYLFKYGCQQIASPAANCVVELRPDQLIGLEDMTWQGMRVGMSGQVRPADRWKITADVAYLPYVAYTWLDDHVQRNLEFKQWGHGDGVETQAVLSYDVTDRLNIGIGARYWAMWSTTGHVEDIPGNGSVRPNRNAVEMAGLFFQTGYRFAPGDAVLAAPVLSGQLPFYKAPRAAPAYSWTGLYGGVEGGGVWGESRHLGQLTTNGRESAPATPWFDVSGGLVGGTVGYSSQFQRLFVVGLEGDASWVGADGSARQIRPFNTNQTGTTDEDWLSTARLRLGVTPATGWLIYGTGGLAVADVEATITPSTLFVPERHIRAGWSAGGGVEAAITGNWSAKLEYLHVGLEDHAYFEPTPNIPSATNRAGGVPISNEIVRGGINYKIDWPFFALPL